MNALLAACARAAELVANGEEPPAATATIAAALQRKSPVDTAVAVFNALRQAGPLTPAAHAVLTVCAREIAEHEYHGVGDAARQVLQLEAPPPGPRDIAQARDAKRQQVLAEAARRTQQSVALYMTVTQLAAIPEERRTPDEQLQLLQHASWAAEREAVEAVRAAKVAEINALATLEQIDAYDVTAGWPQ